MAHSTSEGLIYFSQLRLETEDGVQEARRNFHTSVVYQAKKKFLNTFAYSTKNYQHFAFIYLHKICLMLFFFKFHLITKFCID